MFHTFHTSYSQPRPPNHFSAWQVAELRETVDGERREMAGVCSRYREALDEIARLKGLISASQSSIDGAVAAVEEARLDVSVMSALSRKDLGCGAA